MKPYYCTERANVILKIDDYLIMTSIHYPHDACVVLKDGHNYPTILTEYKIGINAFETLDEAKQSLISKANSAYSGTLQHFLSKKEDLKKVMSGFDLRYLRK